MHRISVIIINNVSKSIIREEFIRIKRKIIAALTVLTLLLCSASYVFAENESIDKYDPQAIE